MTPNESDGDGRSSLEGVGRVRVRVGVHTRDRHVLWLPRGRRKGAGGLTTKHRQRARSGSLGGSLRGVGRGGVADAAAATGLVESRVKLVDSQPSISILYGAELSTAAGAGAESVRVFHAKRVGFSSLGTFLFLHPRMLPSSERAPSLP